MKIDCFIPYSSNAAINSIATQLRKSNIVSNIFVINSEENQNENIKTLKTKNGIFSTEFINIINQNATADYILIYTKSSALILGQHCIERFASVAEATSAGLIYSDFYQTKNGSTEPHPLIDYQLGSVRDDFEFGSLILLRKDALLESSKLCDNYSHAGMYSTRLAISESYNIIHINEFLYTEIEEDTRLSGAKQFDYVDPKNRDRQVEMEKACTEHLKRIGAYLEPRFKDIDFSESFDIEASVIIPVKNRIKTIEDAIKSVLLQKTEFKFNLIIIDNHSTDGTTELIEIYKKTDSRIIHIIPEETNLGIGGCWNVGIEDSRCGKFAVQLDSDDVYSDENTLSKIVAAFYEQKCAMVIGSYMITDFDMNMIPPGVIDHKEWTPENGKNNALRINGLGAPRAFYTPILRKINVPNTSYGEDYALGLQISRHYQIGRIYDVLYLCRRWNDNSDASLNTAKINANNLYKDKLRTIEIIARQNLNKK